jgi:hypothetical protein
LIRRSKSNLDFIRKFIQASRVKFSDKESGELFCRIVLGETEQIDFVLSSLLNYIQASRPLIKRDTVHTLIEEALKKNQLQLEEKKAKLSKRFEKDLPETIIPDEQLRYVLNSVLQHAVMSMPSGGNIGLATRFFVLQRGADEKREPFEKYGRYIEILISFTSHGRPKVVIPPPQKGASSDLILRLVAEIVRRNRGMMKIETHEKKGETIIFLAFPAERRKMVYYQSAAT